LGDNDAIGDLMCYAALAMIVPWIAATVACGAQRNDHAPRNSDARDHLVVWAGDADRKDSEFLAVIDARWPHGASGPAFVHGTLFGAER
jgi:hypothetical protein